jgi:hypothetical protein
MGEMMTPLIAVLRRAVNGFLGIISRWGGFMTYLDLP